MSQSVSMNDNGATVVITHRIHGEKHAEYQLWLDEIAPICKASSGFLDLHIVRPIAGITDTYTVIIRFDTTEHVKAWMSSSEREYLITKVRPLFAGADDFYISSGLDFWFIPTGAKAKIPVRWKQYLITWSAIYPLALGLPYMVSPMLNLFGVTGNKWLTTLIVTAIIAFLMVFVVMPRYTRLVKKWLFK